MPDTPAELRNQRLRPEAVDALRVLKEALLARCQLRDAAGRPLLTRENAMRAYVDAVRQCVANPSAMMPDDRKYTRVRCRNCANTTSVPDTGFSENSKWACRCRPGAAREIFLDAIGIDGAYLLTADAMPFRAPAIEVEPTEDEVIGKFFATA